MATSQLSRNSRFSPIHPLLWRWIGPVPGSCMLLTTIGLLYASGVYVATIDNPLFTKAIGVAFLSCEVGITSIAALLHKVDSDRMYRRAPPILGFLCAVCLAFQGFMPTALRTNNQVLLYTSAVSLGLACAGTYVIGLAVLQAWVPESVGVINAAGMFFTSLASFCGVSLLRKAMHILGGPLRTISTLSIIQSTTVMFFSLLVSCPPRGWHPSWEMQCTSAAGSVMTECDTAKGRGDEIPDEESALLPTSKGEMESSEKLVRQGLSSAVTMTLSEVLTTPSLFPFVIAVVAIIGPGTGLSMAFPHMMAVIFGMGTDNANSWFTCVLAGGIFGRLCGGAAINLFDQFSSDGTGLFASRTLCAAVLMLQTISLLLMPVAIKFGSATVFTILASVIFFSFSAGMVGSACLARSMYTAFNASVTFNMSGFITGIVEMIYARIIADTNEIVGESGRTHPHEFDYFLAFSVVVSILGFLACLSCSLCQKAYRKAGMESLLST